MGQPAISADDYWPWQYSRLHLKPHTSHRCNSLRVYPNFEQPLFAKICPLWFGLWCFYRGSFSFVKGQFVIIIRLCYIFFFPRMGATHSDSTTQQPSQHPQWEYSTLVVRERTQRRNDANRFLTFSFNDQLAISQTNLQIRVADTVAANGLYFSSVSFEPFSIITSKSKLLELSLVGQKLSKSPMTTKRVHFEDSLHWQPCLYLYSLRYWSPRVECCGSTYGCGPTRILQSSLVRPSQAYDVWQDLRQQTRKNKCERRKIYPRVITFVWMVVLNSSLEPYLGGLIILTSTYGAKYSYFGWVCSLNLAWSIWQLTGW